MNRYFSIFLSVLIALAFSSLIIYGVKIKAKPKSIPLKSIECKPDINKGIECINGKPAAAKEVIVTFDKSITGEQIAYLVENLDVAQYHKEIGINTYDIISNHTSTLTLIEQFSKLNGVVYVSPWYISSLN